MNRVFVSALLCINTRTSRGIIFKKMPAKRPASSDQLDPCEEYVDEFSADLDNWREGGMYDLCTMGHVPMHCSFTIRKSYRGARFIVSINKKRPNLTSHNGRPNNDKN